MRGPKEVVEAILRDLAYEESTRTRLGVSKEELQLASRWANAMPPWSGDIDRPQP